MNLKFWKRKPEKLQEPQKAVVIDTNVILRMGKLHAGDILNELGGKIFVPWVVLEELIKFRKQAIWEKRVVERAIERGQIRKLSFLAGLPEEEKRQVMRGKRDFIRRAIAEAIERGEIEKLSFLTRLSKEERRLRRKRLKSALSVWSIFSKKIEDADWKITGSDPALYFEVFGKKVDNDEIDDESETTVGKDIGTPDVRIIASCLYLQKKGLDVILLTKDLGLKRRAMELGVQATSGLSDLID